MRFLTSKMAGTYIFCFLTSLIFIASSNLILPGSAKTLTSDPDIHDDLEPLKMRVGESITCQSGENNGSVEWMKVSGSDRGPDRVKGNVLMLTSNMVGSTNKYRCVVTTPEGQHTKHVLFDLKYEMTCTNEYFSSVDGELLKLACNVSLKGIQDIDTHPPKLAWSDQEGKELVEDGQHGNIGNLQSDGESFSLTQYVVFDDTVVGNNYTCRLYASSEGPSFTDTCTSMVSLPALTPISNIDIKPDVLKDQDEEENGVYNVGDEIHCTANGVPEPGIYWEDLTSKPNTNRGYGPSRNYQGNSQHLIEGNRLVIQENMAGRKNLRFKCVATNTLLSQSSTLTKVITFHVTGKVRDIHISPNNPDRKPLLLRYGQTIQCSAKGNPSPTYVWRRVFPKMGQHTLTTSANLRITSDMRGKYFKYLCTASNESFNRGYSLTAVVRFSVMPA